MQIRIGHYRSFCFPDNTRVALSELPNVGGAGVRHHRRRQGLLDELELTRLNYGFSCLILWADQS